MKNYLLLCVIALCFVWGQSANAQEKTKMQEVGLYTTSILNTNFGVQYKSLIKNDWFFNVQAFNVNGNFSNTSHSESEYFDSKIESYSIGFSVGIEKHKALSDRLTMFSGPCLLPMGIWNVGHNEDPKIPAEFKKIVSSSYHLGLGMTLGMKVKVAEHFNVGAFILPSVVFRYSEEKHLAHTYASPESEYQIRTRYNKSIAGDFSLRVVNIALYYNW